MKLTTGMLTAIVGKEPLHGDDLLQALDMHPDGLEAPHRLAQFLGQILHESGGLKFVEEIWGPTAAQRGYEGRKDLGNTQKGDGSKFRGHGLIQLTGRRNHREFRDWAKARCLCPPDFLDTPAKVAEAPWSGLTAVWFWARNGLSRYADEGDVEMITLRVNGGLNGYADRINWLVRASLVLLGYGATDVKEFQAANPPLAVDGIAGPRTRAALHQALMSRRETD